MSNPRIDPHPDKWLSASKASKPATQRPLVGSQFRAHAGIATPPTSSRRGSASNAPKASGSTSRKRQAPNTTPTAPPPGTRSIESYLTPATTGPQPAKTKHSSSRLKNVSHLHTSPTRRSPRLNRDPLAVVSEWRASLPPSVTSPVKRSRDLASPSPSSPTPPSNLVEALKWDRSGPSDPDPPPASRSSALTPIPASFMARHPHCSGQHSGRQRATTSPRRREVPVEDNESAPRAPRRHLTYVENDEPRIERERKRLRLDIREAADKKEGIRVREKREKRELGGFKSLAHLSSDPSSSPRSSSPSERAPLAPKNPNALRRHSSAVEEPVCARDPKWPQRPITRLPVIPSAFPQRSQLIPSAFPQRSQVIPSAFPGRQRTEAPRDLSQPSSSSKTAPVKPSLATQSSRPPAASSTPRARRIAHHHVTPPKSRTPQRRDMQETLFELPPAPRQPVFRPVSPTPVRDWQPVEMQAETLMTWSMGGANPASVEQPAPPSSPPIREGEYSDEPIRVVEVVDDDETNCLAGSIPSQYFPNLLETSSSPIRPPRDSKSHPSPKASPKRSSVRRASTGSPASVVEIDKESSSPSPRRSLPPSNRLSSPPPFAFQVTSLPIKSPSKSTVKHLVRRSKQDPEQRRKTTDHALYSSLSEASQLRSAPRVRSFPRPTQNRKTPPLPKTQSQSQTQSKLEAFGISRLRPLKTREFETAFSDEEDLDFEVDLDDHSLSPAVGPFTLRVVPSAPPHPSLRAAGIREQQKRESAALERHNRQKESLRSVHDGSSSLPMIPLAMTDGGMSSSSQSDGRLEISEDTRAWFHNLGNETMDEV